MNQELEALKSRLENFAKERDWEQFHTPKNLIMALNGEVGELNEIFQWLSEEDARHLSIDCKAKAEEEIADIFLYLVRLSAVLGIDLLEVSNLKIDKNALKYPVEKSKGNSKKYTEL